MPRNDQLPASPVAKLGPRNVPVPTYRRIADDIRATIQSGKWPVGSMLPSQRDLAAHYGVQQLTLNKAIRVLTVEGMLCSEQRKGTFVVEKEPQAVISGEAHRPAARDARALRGAAPSPGLRLAKTVGIIGTRDMSRQGIDSPDLEGLYNFVVRGLEHALSHAGATTVFVPRTDPAGRPLPLSEVGGALLLQGADALAICGDEEPEALVSFLSGIDTRRTPVVFIGSRPVPPPGLCVYSDDRNAGALAVQHLVECGCRSMLFFSPWTENWVVERLEGVREAMRMAGYPPEAVSASVGATHVYEGLAERGYEEAALADARQLLAAGPPPTGVIAANDMMAYGFLSAAAEHQLQAGRDYSLIGFDDTRQSRSLGLSTMRPPGDEMGAEAARLLVAAMNGENSAKSVCLYSHLVVRSSSRLLSPMHAALAADGRR